jgi:Type II secretion system (T2SS), protein K
VKTHHNNRKDQPASRRGSVLYVVLVVIALLTLAAYQFSEIMITERSATNIYGRRVQARALADSGVELAAAMLGERQLITSENAADVNLYFNQKFHQQMIGAFDDSPRSRGHFCVVSPVESDETGKTVRLGLADESGKLNLNVLSKLTGDDEEGQERAQYILMAIPGMTIEIADAILDWIDKDEDERPNGAENSYYEPLGYQCKNGPIESLDELLLIRGVTPQMVFGFDANRNGIIDSEEATAAAQSPDVHPLGWSAYLTVRSKEANKRLDGSDKIDLSNGVLADLYDQLIEEFTEDGNAEDVAKFIVAYLMNGPKNAEESQPASQGVSSSNSASGGQSSRGGSSTGGATLNSQAVSQAAQGVAKSLFSAASSGDPVTRAGMDLSGGAKVKINSLYDLVDAEVEVKVNGTTSTMKSPFTLANIATDMPKLQDRLSTTKNKFIEGRVNVNQARKEVLLGVVSAVDGFYEDPNLAEDLVNKIVAAKMVDADGQPRNDVIASHSTTAWLVTENIVTLQQMRQLDRYLTTRGDVYRGQSIGFYDLGGPTSRLEFVIDATQKPPRVVFMRDLTDLGKGFTPKQMGSKTD